MENMNDTSINEQVKLTTGSRASLLLKKAYKNSWLENIVCYGSLSILALIPFTELILRQFSLAIPDPNALISHFFLVAGLFAAMLTAKTGNHISVTAVQYIKSDNVKKILTLCCTVISVFLVTILAWNSVSYIIYGLMGRSVGPVTDKVFAIAMPLGFSVIAIRFVLGLHGWLQRTLGFSAVLFGCFAALPAIAKIIWGVNELDTPEPFYSLVNFQYDIAMLFNIPVILFLILAGLAGMPIFAVIGGIAMVMLQAVGQEPDRVAQEIYSALTERDIIAIPLFTLTGFFLSESKAGERLVRTFKIFFGWMPGGIIIATIIICAFFSSFTGASGVTILALGGILFTILKENKYPEKLSIGMLTSAGGIGLMFPPSLPIILVASSIMTILHFMNIPTDYNHIHFFIGALIPGLILIAAMIFTSFVLSRKVKIPKEKFKFSDAMRSLKDSFFEILLPIILVFGYFSGIFTLVQVSAVSVVYVVIVEVFIKRDIPITGIPDVFKKAVPIIGGILAILAMAKALSYAFIDSGVPDSFSFWMQNTIQSRIVFLLLLNVALLIIGFFMDIFSAILVFLPLIVPLGIVYGIDPLHLGIIFVINLEAGFLTPPVGINLFLASYRFNKPFMHVCGYVMPFLLARLVVVLIVTFIPELSTWLVKFFM
ncbi:MAG: TRAP transporter large permease subunit [Treponema sp.]|jgi:tripartite ATP-independent transporter DctM subunit|nr:TRAP transporter large permease subunit [Treponema sp.]